MNYSRSQLFFLVILRLLIGWHFLYEGFLKLLNPGWTSAGYLMGSEGPLSGLFHWLGSGPLAGFADVATISILLVTGLSLLLGIREKLGAYLGMSILLLFYLSYPPLPGYQTGPTEGNYFIVNKNLIELVALGVITCFPTAGKFGLEQLFTKKL